MIAALLTAAEAVRLANEVASHFGLPVDKQDDAVGDALCRLVMQSDGSWLWPESHVVKQVQWECGHQYGYVQSPVDYLSELVDTNDELSAPQAMPDEQPLNRQWVNEQLVARLGEVAARRLIARLVAGNYEVSDSGRGIRPAKQVRR
mgnify:CR=1 FL=1